MICFERFHVYAAGVCLLMALANGSAHATSYSWKSGPVFVGFPNSWTPTGVPGISDSATFGLNGSYTVLFNTTLSVADLSVTTGDVTFASYGGTQSLLVDDSYKSTISLPNSNGGTSLTIGAAGAPLDVKTVNLDMENGANFYLSDGSQLFLGLGVTDPISRINGSMYVTGSDSKLVDLPGVAAIPVVHFIGSNGGTGLLSFGNGSTGNVMYGPLLIAADASSGTGEVDVGGVGAGALTLHGDLYMANYNVGSRSATMYIDGAGSALTQTDVPNASTGISVGSDENSSAAIYIGTLVSGGTLSTGTAIGAGTAALNINATGAVIVGSGSTTGTLNANGDIMVDGGLLQIFAGSQFNLASGKTLHITGGTVDFKSFNINGSRIDFVAGSLSYAGNLLVGTGGVLGTDLTLDNTRQLSLTGTTSIDPTRTLAITGGALHTGAIVNNGVFDFIAGSLSYSGNLLVGTGGLLGAYLTLDTNRQLSLTGTTTIDPGHFLSISGGSLHTGSLVNNGVLGVGIGTLTTGTASLAAGSVLDIYLSGTTRNTQYGALVASGAVSLAGSLIVTLNSFTPVAGNSFDILDGSLSGTFTNLQLPALPAGLAWSISSLYTTGVLSVIAAGGVPGDYNGNGIVDAADYTVWRDHLGQTFALPNRSAANTGPIAAADFTFWKSQFGQHAGSGSAATVPEPASLWMFVTGIAWTFCCRRSTVS